AARQLSLCSPPPLCLSLIAGVKSGVRESGFQLQLIHHNHLSLKDPVKLATHRQIIVKTTILLEPGSCLRFTPATTILLSTTGPPFWTHHRH
ncbi:hypothetical protein J4Q44_G00238780, partial [Coregonus suidteri]